MTNPFDHLDTEAITKATQAIVKKFNTRLATELLGAWMAGYDYLDVYRSPAMHSSADPSKLNSPVGLKMAFIPYYGERPIDQSAHVTTYVLDNIQADEAETIRGTAGR